MVKKIIIITGFPGVGKDSTIRKITTDHPNIHHFKKHRGTSNDFDNDTYYNISLEEFETMRRQDEFLQYHDRYHKKYGISKTVLNEIMGKYEYIIIQTGRVEDTKIIEAYLSERNIELLKVYVWNDYSIILERIIGREKEKEKIQQRLDELHFELRECNQNMDFVKGYDMFMQSESVDKSVKMLEERILYGNNFGNEEGFLNLIHDVIKKNDDCNVLKINNKKIDDIDKYTLNFKKIYFDNCVFTETANRGKGMETKLMFTNCKFEKYLNIKQTKAPFEFADCIFENKIDVFGHQSNVSFKFSTIKKLIIKNSKIEKISFVQSELDELIIDERSEIVGIFFNQSNISKIMVGVARIENLEFSNSTYVDIADLNNLKDYILFVEKSKISQINVSESFVKKLTKRNFEKNLMSDKKKKLILDKKRKNEIIFSTILVIHQSLENNKNQKLADSLYIKLRQIQLRKNLYDPSINFFDKIREIFVFVIVGYFFGWGVKVRNTVYTILLTIVCYAFIYNREMTFVMNGSKIENFKEALLFSFSRTFSIGEDLYTPGVMTFLDYSHGFLSLVLITIFTGVFMRKIIT